MLAASLMIGFVVIALAIAITFVRLLIGPDLPDRILALDTLYVGFVGLLVLLGIDGRGAAFFEVALLVTLIGFLGTVALARFALRGNVVE